MHQMQPGNPSQSAPGRWPVLWVIGRSVVMFRWSLCRQPSAVSNFFIDGTPLTGQSDHLVNLQIGLEDTDRLSQQRLLLSYVSDRVRPAVVRRASPTSMSRRDWWWISWPARV